MIGIAAHRIIKRGERMDAEVTRLLDTDKKAREIMEDAREYYARTLQDIETEKKRLARTYERRMEQRLSEIDNSERTAVHAAAADAKKKYARLTEEMELVFEQNRQAWEDALFTGCTAAREA
jgi:hemerythrin-like domain-containing protein